MKKLFILLFSIISYASFGQNNAQLPQPNGKIKDPNLDKLVGNWIWIDGKDTLRVTLKKESYLIPNIENSYVDVIVGYLQFKQGDVVVENTLAYVNDKYTTRRYSIFGMNEVGTNKGYTECNLLNKAKNKQGSLILRLNGKGNQLTWELKSNGVINSKKPTSPDFSYPRALTLIKQ